MNAVMMVQITFKAIAAVRIDGAVSRFPSRHFPKTI